MRSRSAAIEARRCASSTWPGPNTTNGGRTSKPVNSRMPLTPVAEGTRFERKFVYPSSNLLFAIANRISIRSKVEQESDRAVRNVKRVLESMA
jgi:hypothetical protein